MFSDTADESEEVFFEGTIHPSWITRKMISNSVGSGCVIIILVGLLIGLSTVNIPDYAIYIIVAFLGFIFLGIAARYAWAKAHVRNFSFQITGTHIIIQQGVFSKRRDLIPFNRIQNIKVHSGFFDRMYNLSSVHIETAGSSAVMYKGRRARTTAEGFIPGQKDPTFIESKIREMVKKQGSGGGT